MKYIVLEIQINDNGTVGTLVNSFDAQNTAESKYHDILKYAAISTIPKHTAVIITEEGRVLEKKCYDHTIIGVSE